MKKIIAGIAAAAVAAGGVAAVLSQSEPAPAEPMVWSGYGEIGLISAKRYEMTVDEMDDAYISGHLEVSDLYEIKHDSDFTGVGTTEDGKTLYTLTFETPAVVGTIPTYEYTQMELEYDKATDCFSFRSVYDCEMERISRADTEVLAENERWSGLGEDDFYVGKKSEGHLFEVDVYKMTEAEISGRLTVSYNGEVDHLTEFTGRGYMHDGIVRYEILLETPRTGGLILAVTVDSFWMQYDPETKIMEIQKLQVYSAEMEQVVKNEN